MRAVTSTTDRSPVMPGRSAGFTLFEITLTMLVIVMVLGGVLALFTANQDLARVQTHVANMQQSIRVAQYEMVRHVRMTGRGPLPQGALPNGRALAVANNVAANTHISSTDAGSPLVVEGTDVLTIRGVFNTPLYQFSPTAGVYSQDGVDGTLVIIDRTPTGIPQNLRPIADAIDMTVDESKPEALLVVSPLDDAIYAVLEFSAASSYTEAIVDGVTQVTQVNIAFRITGGERTTEYNTLMPNGAYPPNMQTASFAGLLEEYRYYIREGRANPLDPTSQLTPSLSRARMYPGSQVPYLESAANYAADVANDIFDLQIALAIDTDGDAQILENEPPDGDDDWLYNSASDGDTDTAKWVGVGTDPLRKLFYVRINTLARAARQDRGFEAALLTNIEDKDYTVSPGDYHNQPDQRAYRRRIIQSIVDTRNVP